MPRSYMRRRQLPGWVKPNLASAKSALDDQGLLHGVDDKTQPTQGSTWDRSAWG